MNRPPQGRGQPRLGATWYPGGQDDFYMPEVISPSPQRCVIFQDVIIHIKSLPSSPPPLFPLDIVNQSLRVMPEVPESMQDNIAHLEHEVRNPHRSQQASLQHAHFPERTSSAAIAVSQGQPQYYNQSDYGSGPYEQSATFDSMNQPNFSPFPVLRDPPPNVPPTSEQREASLESARMPVLSSNDPEMQLSWAQDTLSYVEVAMQNEARLSLIQPPRPQTPPVEHQLKLDAMNVVGFLADQYHPKADFIKGTWLEFGKFNHRVDKREAFKAYSRSADKGYARAEYRIGMQFESSGEAEKAIKHYERGVAGADSASYYVSFPTPMGFSLTLTHHDSGSE